MTKSPTRLDSLGRSYNFLLRSFFMSRIGFALFLTLALFATGCGYGSHYMGGSGSPTVATLTPNMATAGDSEFTLTVNGANFGTDAVVFWNGVALASRYGTTMTVMATVPAADVAAAGVIPVSVHSGGKISNAIDFTVQ
jgi:hypothetical protein